MYRDTITSDHRQRREDLQREVEQFLASGGQKQEIPAFQMTTAPRPSEETAEELRQRQNFSISSQAQA